MNTFEIKGRKYQARRMDAFKQLHVARRLLPILAKAPEMLGLKVGEILGKASTLAKDPVDMLDNLNLQAIADAIAGVPDADVEFLLNTCLDYADIKNSKGTGWAPVRNDGELMFDFIRLPEMIRIAAAVIKENLSDFFDGNAPTFLEPTAKAE